MVQQPTHIELIQVAFDETRRGAATHPTVCLYLLAAIESLIETLEAAGLAHRATELHRQARLVSDGCGKPDVLDEDIEHVRQTYMRKFMR